MHCSDSDRTKHETFIVNNLQQKGVIFKNKAGKGKTTERNVYQGAFNGGRIVATPLVFCQP